MDKLKNKKFLVTLAGILVAIFLFLAYVLVGYTYSYAVSNGTKIANIDLSGKSDKEAVKFLENKLSEDIKKPLVLNLKDKVVSVLPADLSIKPDYEKTIKNITYFTLNPIKIYERIKGNPNASLVVTKVNEKANKDRIFKLQQELGKAPVDATIHYEGTNPVLTPSSIGEGFDEKHFYNSLAKQWFVAKEIKLNSKKINPNIDDKEAKKTFEEVAKPLVASAMTLKVGDSNAEISPEILAESAKFTPKDSKLLLEINGDFVSEKIFSQLGATVSKQQDAKVIIENNAPKIIPSQVGKNVDSNALAENIVKNASKFSNREFDLPITDIKPEFDTQAAQNLGVKEVIGEYTIPIKGEVKRQNLIVGANKINNSLVKPGETFSYNDKLTPVTAANGFVKGLAIVGNSYGWAYGGGLCQLATTIFNAAFLGGMQDVEHRAHSEYFSEYPLGRDSAYWEGSLDLKFKNDTPYGVVVQSYVEGWNLHVKLWSTKYYEVKTTTGSKYGFVSFATRRVESSNCVGNSVGSAGFSVDVWRGRYVNGKQHDQNTYTARYKPSDIVKCGKEEKKVSEEETREEVQLAPEN
ncbi:VanW family protein [Actinomyces sp. zg-332]|uniref:VanW family protein n=1 Tax=Actinomyces sp. zg-332 TaxID=2708340 RepID=UPI0014218206|nr:VanW family protein [Actinomyces sp. zg-332]QPK93811.1 VanW family protein [Actinomyces sp. zg-332]